ncbi:MAG TPA: ParB N-terminal domain-containing protein [Candidatus Acidoferrum sp.]|nr:ParB N-terminal domain-containing protein [Candidatus Acidoferrum sp.]
MADTVTLLDPRKIKRNTDNPRLIFRKSDLDALQKSISDQGILVPLTVFKEGSGFRLLDGERRWRCATKLGMSHVPVILQPKPARLQNIMMMFAIHHARTDWDPLPTALKLQDLEKEFTKRNGRRPTETELAGLSSMTRGEVRRLKKLLALPEDYRKELLDELNKPKSEQLLTVDHVLEATAAASLLRKRDVVDAHTEDRLRRAIVHKFRTGVIKNTVAPRKLAKLARAVQRKEVPLATAKKVIAELIESPNYDIDEAFRDSVEKIDFEHTLEQQVKRLISGLEEHSRRRYKPSESLVETLRQLVTTVNTVVARP